MGMRVSKGRRGKGVIAKIKQNTKEVRTNEQEKKSRKKEGNN